MRLKLKLGRSPKAEVKTVCAECQTPIAANATYCEKCHAPIVRRYCPKCSRLVPENTKLCPYCGTSSKVKARDTASLSNVAVIVVLLAAALFFLAGGFFPSEKETKQIEPPPAVKLADHPVSQAHLKNATHLSAGSTQQVSGGQPIVRSEEEGTRLNLQAYELIQLKDYKQAEPLLRRAIQSFPQGTTSVAYKYSLYNLGHVLRRTGKAKEAVPFLEQCLKMDPQWSKAQTELAVAKAEAGTTSVTQISSL